MAGSFFEGTASFGSELQKVTAAFPFHQFPPIVVNLPCPVTTSALKCFTQYGIFSAKCCSKTGMNKDRLEYHQKINKYGIERIKAELPALNREMVNADGVQLKPSQCYHFESDPLHVLFNTNCPEELRQKVQDIISRHTAAV